MGGDWRAHAAVDAGTAGGGVVSPYAAYARAGCAAAIVLFGAGGGCGLLHVVCGE